MANEEQLSILKLGVEVWNKWRDSNPNIDIDLSEADLIGCDLVGSDLSGAKLSKADLKEVNLSEANLMGALLNEAYLWRANLGKTLLIEANLRRAYLAGAKLSGADLEQTDLEDAQLKEADLQEANLKQSSLIAADLTRANLSRSNLSAADLRSANLTEANLSKTELYDTDFSKAKLIGSNFLKAQLGDTIFRNSDLSRAKGLGKAVHYAGSSISIDTFARSQGKIPEAFLRGCGLSDWEIEAVKLYNPDLSNEEITNIQYQMYDLRATQSIQISPLFISYSHDDGTFVDKIESHLNEKGVRFWRDIHDMKSGRMERQIDRAIRQNPIVLLILSKNSLESDWVEHEVHTARDLEKDLGRDVLCPVALDDSWSSKTNPWPQRIMEQIKEYNIVDFSAWDDDSKFEDTFRKLIDGLELFYKG